MSASGYVPSLPKRNGNGRGGVCVRIPSKQFPAYLRGMETPGFLPTDDSHYLVPSLPKRNGNSLGNLRFKVCQTVPSLPKRNGNRSSALITPCFFSVPSLPKRNGNSLGINFPSGLGIRFPAYLRGMETSGSLRIGGGLDSSQPT